LFQFKISSAFQFVPILKFSKFLKTPKNKKQKETAEKRNKRKIRSVIGLAQYHSLLCGAPLGPTSARYTGSQTWCLLLARPNYRVSVFFQSYLY
jgi:hypothetical protein